MHPNKHVHLHRTEMYLKSNRNSHSSDTSSAYSGSDTMQSVHSSSLEDQEVDLSGLIESVVDTDEEEDLAESIDVSTEIIDNLHMACNVYVLRHIFFLRKQESASNHLVAQSVSLKLKSR